MAIYHLHAKIVGRSGGRSATAAAAYRAGVCIADQRTGLVFDFSRRKYVVWRAIAAPDDAADWVCDREKLWNSAEQIERRRDAQIAREIEVSIPRELPDAARLMLIAEFVNSEFVARGMVADIAIHDNPENPHCHILLTLRELLPNGFGQKVRAWNDKDLLMIWRESWANHCNRVLQREGISQRIDHRTLIAQGCRRTAERYEGIRRKKLRRKLQQRETRRETQRQEFKTDAHEGKVSCNETSNHEIASDIPSFAEHLEASIDFDISQHDYLERIKHRLQNVSSEENEIQTQERNDSNAARSRSFRPKTPSR